MSEWISVEDRLPEMKSKYISLPECLESDRVLVTSGNYCAIGKLAQTYKRKITRWEDYGGRVICPTHWMPLPALPEVKA